MGIRSGRKKGAKIEFVGQKGEKYGFVSITDFEYLDLEVTKTNTHQEEKVINQ